MSGTITPPTAPSGKVCERCLKNPCKCPLTSPPIIPVVERVKDKEK